MFALNNVKCDLHELVDTDSPIAFIKFSTFNKVFESNVNAVTIPKLTYRALNGEPVAIIGQHEHLSQITQSKTKYYTKCN